MARKLSKVAKRFTEAARQAMKASLAIGLLGFDVELVEPGRAVLRLDVKPHHKQVHGVVHGGIVAALADTAGGMAAYSVVPRGTAVATVELKINYLEAVPAGRLTAEARVLRAGRNFVVAECDVLDDKRKLVAKALLTFGAAGGHSLEK
jgi:uncharacterized protein (TIGR00369 family)